MGGEERGDRLPAARRDALLVGRRVRRQQPAGVALRRQGHGAVVTHTPSVRTRQNERASARSAPVRNRTGMSQVTPLGDPGLTTTVWTVGHSTRPVEELLSVLRAHGIATLVDVRSIPASRRNPQFARDAIAKSCADAALRYAWMGDSLGGLRRAPSDSRHVALRVVFRRLRAREIGFGALQVETEIVGLELEHRLSFRNVRAFVDEHLRHASRILDRDLAAHRRDQLARRHNRARSLFVWRRHYCRPLGPRLTSERRSTRRTSSLASGQA